MADFTFEDAAHVLRRMGFGGGPAEIDELVPRGREGAIDYLLDFDSIDNQPMDQLIARSFDFSDPDNFERFNPDELRRWWFTRMIHSSRQFQEKMTLFWHNFFATANSKVPERLMYVQNVLLRDNALSPFHDLLLRVAQDPAMLVWLDGVNNITGEPNENFAREVQELFSMGITDVVTGQPNYSENDVKEIARAFTGWNFFLQPRSNPYDFRFFVNPPAHDNGRKTIYGQTANFTGADVIGIIASRRATARFLVKKLFELFVYPLSSSETDISTIERMADVYMNRNHSIRALVRAIFVSDEFFSSRARFALIKSPIELIVGAIRMSGARYNPGTYRDRDRSYLPGFFSTAMGQEAFNPPDVAGWDLNLGWINTAALLLRYNFADLLVISRPANPEAPGLWLTHDRIQKYAKPAAKKTVKKLLSLFGPLNVSDETTRSLIDYLNTGDRGETVPYVNDASTVDKKIRGLIHQIMCLPEFQMN